MSHHVGSSTVYSTILPNQAAVHRLRSVRLFREAKHRLKVIEYYLARHSVAITIPSITRLPMSFVLH